MDEVLFIVCVAIICALALALIVWIVVALVKQNRKSAERKVIIVDDIAYELVPVGEAPTQNLIVTAAQPAAQTAPVPEPAADPQAEEDEEDFAVAMPFPDADEEGTITLRRNETVPYPEAYLRLSRQQKGFVDEIIRYAESKEGVKKVVNDKSASVYLGKKLVVRIILRRGMVTARLTVQNNDFIAYTDNAGLNIKEKPIDIKVEDGRMVSSVKDIIDITYRDLMVERARRDEEKRAARREKRRLARERAQAESAESQNESGAAAEIAAGDADELNETDLSEERAADDVAQAEEPESAEEPGENE